MTREIKIGGDGIRLLGVVHLPPLPGSPAYGGSRTEIRRAARRDAEVLTQEGLEGFVVENFGDAPFRPERVEASVVAEMAVIVADLVARHPDAAVGVNVLRNDARAALAVAIAAGANFIRVNVHQGLMVTDQGPIRGRADETLRRRRELDARVAILADVAVKHATPPPGFDLSRAAAELVDRGGADGVIVTGSATGASADRAELAAVRAAVGRHPVLVGSGVDPGNIAEFLAVADAVIVGTSLKEAGDVRRPVDPARVRDLVRAASA